MEKKIEHVQSFINVLQARQQFMEAQYNKNESLCRSTGSEALDITQNTDDYNTNMATFLNELENKQLEINIVDKAIESTVVQLNLNKDPRHKVILDLMSQFATVTMKERELKWNFINLKRELVNKNRSSVHDIDKLLKVIESKVEEQQSVSEIYKNMAKKVKKLNIVHDVLNCFLSEVDGEILFEDPKLLEILKKNRKHPLFKLEH